jgi:hypothetical protein
MARCIVMLVPMHVELTAVSVLVRRMQMYDEKGASVPSDADICLVSFVFGATCALFGGIGGTDNASTLLQSVQFID